MNTEQSIIADWLRLIQGEYIELPGLRLTKPEIQRLWGLDPHTCDALLDTLLTAKFLEETPHGAYVLANGDY